jgi:PGF-CTERM protein
MTGSHTLLMSVLLGALLVGAVVAPAGATQTEEAPGPSMTVDLAADGDARVTLVSTFDLDDESEQAAFEALQTNETARSAYEARQTDRWQAVADATANRTGREMTVTNSSLALSQSNTTGVATFSVTWEALAAAENGMLTLDEPFASGFSPDRRLVVVLPENYQLESISPGPSNTTDTGLVYDAGSDLNGFSMVATSTAGVNVTPDAASSATPVSDRTPVTTTGGSGPGFGAVGALAALAAAALLAGRRG